ncbi:MAG: selenocysteine-specific translation elongation factor [Terriglobales bacterium]
MMKSVIAGTAGHIDHGKTALVKALTGIDADRLEEEKRRGITIDIGFAHLELPAPSGTNGDMLRLGFVDVPGHERFVRNMLAGVGGIDLVLLVIAADESIKPQTREHFDICRMLNIRRGITVLTKSDLVDQETLEVVRLEVEEFLRASFLEGAPIVAVSSLTGAGLDELKQVLAQVAAEVPVRDSQALFRLPIDRVFTMKGFGTVVTGTLISGSVRKEEEVEVYPAGKRVRVRGIQVHNAPADVALAGQRTALNLAGVATEELARGMMLAPAGLLRPTRRADVQITLLADARPLKDRARVHFHCYTAETIAEVVLLSAVEENPEPQRTQGTQKQLKPGESAWAQLRFAEPLLLLPGDRFILRQFSPVVTIGGGVVADNAPLPLRGVPANRPLNEYVRRAFMDGRPSDQLLARVHRRGWKGLSLLDVIAETGWTHQQLEASIAEVRGKPEDYKLPPNLDIDQDFFLRVNAILRCDNVLVTNAWFFSAQKTVFTWVTNFHAANPLVAGISKEELREKLNLSPEIFNGVLDALVRDKKLEVTGEQVRLAGRGVVMKDEEAESKRQIEDAFVTAGLKVPALKEVLAGLKVDRARAQKIVTLLLRDRVLVKVSEDLVFHRAALETLRQQIAEYKKTSPRIDVSKFKDLTGVSRKYAIPLLEYLDRERVTRRVGDERVIL